MRSIGFFLVVCGSLLLVLYLVVDREDGYRCRVFVQYGRCSTFVTVGTHFVQALYDTREEAAHDTFTLVAGEIVEWTITD